MILMSHNEYNIIIHTDDEDSDGNEVMCEDVVDKNTTIEENCYACAVSLVHKDIFILEVVVEHI